MGNPRKNSIATKAPPALAWLLVLALAWAGFAHAQSVGTVTNLSGPLLARKADGAIRVLAQNSAVDQGDTLVSQKDTYARIKFTDTGEVTLRPNTQFRIEAYSYDAAKPESDNVVFRLLKGGLRSITGLLGQRSKDRFAVNTPLATIGIRGTDFVVQYVPEEQPVAAALTQQPVQLAWAYAPNTDAPLELLPEGAPSRVELAQLGPGSGLAPGLYVHVIDGLIQLSNRGGVQQFSAGQFGFTGSIVQPPVILPNNPGLQFNPPPSFSSTGGQSGGSSGGGKPGVVDCEVR